MIMKFFRELFKKKNNYYEYKIIQSSFLFKEDWYRKEYLENNYNIDAIDHYLKKGKYLGCNPNSTFSNENYNIYYDDVAKAQIDPFLHYIQFGKNEGRLENPITDMIRKQFDIVEASNLFDVKWYNKTYKEILPNWQNPIIHYLTEGWLKGFNPSPNFSTFGYLMRYDDIYKKHINPLVHYIESGKKEKRHPKPQPISDDLEAIIKSNLFDADWYGNKYKKRLDNEKIALIHFLKIGWSLGLDPSENFSTLGYLDIHRDIKTAKINPFIHYIIHGKDEGRNPKPDPRTRNLRYARITPEEIGHTDTVLKFDTPHIPIEGIENERICIHVHLYYENMIDDVINYLKNVQYKFQLLVSVRESSDVAKIEQHFRENLEFPDSIIVRSMPNIGRDVAPWIAGFSEEIQKSTIFCHFHTKRSLHNKAHNGWFRYLSHVILGSAGVVDQILNEFVVNAQVGIMAPFYHWTLASQPNYGKNRDVCSRLYKELTGDKLPEQCVDYPAGSFFWARTSVLKPLFDLQLTWNDFDDEEGQVDGTIAHGIERIIGFLPIINGYDFKQITVDVAYNLLRFFDHSRNMVANNIKICNWKNPSTLQKASKFNINKTRKTAVFTANIGEYDAVMPVIYNHQNIDRFIIVDKYDAPVTPGYKSIVSNYINPSAVRTARFAKTHPHIFFPDYDYVFWIDSNVYFLGDCNDYIDHLESKKAEFGTILHNIRSNAIEECKVLQQENIIDVDISNRQMERYQNELDLNALPLFETNFFLCKPKSEAIQNFMSLWWAQINQFTHRDQLSVNYAAFLANVKWTNLIDEGLSTRDHPDFLLFAHANKNRLDIIKKVTEI